jgi:hypothetical protein
MGYKPGRRKDMKHFVMTYMNGNQGRSRTYAAYHGEREDFPVKAAFWQDACLVVPHWFTSQESALEYIEKLNSRTLQTYCLVQERHYAKGDPRIATAKIITSLENDFPIQPSRGKTQEKYGDPEIDVWTMYIMGRDLAEQYVDAFNADIAAALADKVG